MPEQEVIKISDAESDDEVQVMEVREVHRPQNRRIRRGNNLETHDDDIQIVRVNENPNRTQSPGVVLHTPGGEVLVPHDNAEEVYDQQVPIGLLNQNEAREREALENRYRSYEEIERNRVMREREPRNRFNTAVNRGRTNQRGALRNQRHNRRTVRWSPFESRRIENTWDPGAYDTEEEDEEDDPEYFPGMNIPPLFFHQHAYQLPPFFTFGGDFRGGQDDDLPLNIMQLIEQRENAEFDRKRETNLTATDKFQQDLRAKADKIKNPYSTKIDPEENYVCILCGVTLGEGIPTGHKINKSQPPLAKLQEENDIQAPYQALTLLTDADRDLSKRIFLSKCGHAYCGRCVKNIAGIKEALKRSKKRFKKDDNDISNPFLYAPLTCVGLDCKTKLSGKTTFNELFL